MKHKATLVIGALLSAASSVSAQTDPAISANIVFIGNSITYGALHEQRELTSPPAQACKLMLQHPEVDTLYYSNQGRSGRTTTDFLPQTRTYFPKVTQAADRLVAAHPDIPLLFSLMLGTNDSAHRPTNPPADPRQYHRNLRAIIDSLLARYPQAGVVLHRVIFYSPNTHTLRGSRMGDEGLKRLELYYREYDRLTAHYDSLCPGRVSIGDRQAYDYFRQHYRTAMFPEKGREGTFYLHPNPEGAQALGRYWGESLLKRLQEIRLRQHEQQPFRASPR